MMGRTVNCPFLIFVAVLVVYVKGQGRMLEPPGRSTLWRFGYDTPVNMDDNSLSCGGVVHEWSTNKGKCGVCGDPWDVRPRDNEAGGKYATGLIARIYETGKILETVIDITVMNGGYFEFHLCKNDNISKVVTEDCFERYPLFVAGTNSTQYRDFQLGPNILHLRLPRDLSCAQCVLRWKYRTADHMGCEKDTHTNKENCCFGCGDMQTEYYACADIAIVANLEQYISTLKKKNIKIIDNPDAPSSSQSGNSDGNVLIQKPTHTKPNNGNILSRSKRTIGFRPKNGPLRNFSFGPPHGASFVTPISHIHFQSPPPLAPPSMWQWTSNINPQMLKDGMSFSQSQVFIKRPVMTPPRLASRPPPIPVEIEQTRFLNPAHQLPRKQQSIHHAQGHVRTHVRFIKAPEPQLIKQKPVKQQRIPRCKAIGAFTSQELDHWCDKNCHEGSCVINKCSCPGAPVPPKRQKRKIKKRKQPVQTVQAKKLSTLTEQLPIDFNSMYFPIEPAKIEVGPVKREKIPRNQSDALDSCMKCPFGKCYDEQNLNAMKDNFPGLFQEPDKFLECGEFKQKMHKLGEYKVLREGVPSCPDKPIHPRTKRQVLQIDNDDPACCATKAEVVLPLSVESKRDTYRVVRLPNNSSQIMVQGVCDHRHTRNCPRCIAEKTLQWVLVYDAKIKSRPPVNFVPVSFPHFCKCVNPGRDRPREGAAS